MASQNSVNIILLDYFKPKAICSLFIKHIISVKRRTRLIATPFLFLNIIFVISLQCTYNTSTYFFSLLSLLFCLLCIIMYVYFPQHYPLLLHRTFLFLLNTSRSFTERNYAKVELILDNWMLYPKLYLNTTLDISI